MSVALRVPHWRTSPILVTLSELAVHDTLHVTSSASLSNSSLASIMALSRTIWMPGAKSLSSRDSLTFLVSLFDQTSPVRNRVPVFVSKRCTSDKCSSPKKLFVVPIDKIANLADSSSHSLLTTNPIRSSDHPFLTADSLRDFLESRAIRHCLPHEPEGSAPAPFCLRRPTRSLTFEATLRAAARIVPPTPLFGISAEEAALRCARCSMRVETAL